MHGPCFPRCIDVPLPFLFSFVAFNSRPTDSDGTVAIDKGTEHSLVDIPQVLAEGLSLNMSDFAQLNDWFVDNTRLSAWLASCIGGSVPHVNRQYRSMALV